PHSPSLLFYCYLDLRDLPSFPTRRSSDLLAWCRPIRRTVSPSWSSSFARRRAQRRLASGYVPPTPGMRSTWPSAGCPRPPSWMRSEEHTSELQSLTNLVCRLLLEKKKQPH